MLDTFLQCPRCGSPIRLSLLDLIPTRHGQIFKCTNCSGDSVFPRNTRYLLGVTWVVYLGFIIFVLRSAWLIVPAFLLGALLALVFIIRRRPKLISFDMSLPMRRVDAALLFLSVALFLGYCIFSLLKMQVALG